MFLSPSLKRLVSKF